MRDLAGWLSYISTQHKQEIALGLTRSRAVAQRLGVARVAPLQLVVAGTNGKGSTALFAESLLQAQGLRVGTALSPHLARFNERVRLAGVEVSDDRLCEAFRAVEAAREEIPLTYYEYAVLAALWSFQQAQLDACVLEIGLGGRLDTINLLDADVGVITNIGLDHQDLLGDTLEAIGAEKVAICRPGRPAVLGHPQMPNSVYEFLGNLGCPSSQYGRDFWLPQMTTPIPSAGGGVAVEFATGERLLCSSTPSIAPHNVAVATAAVRLLTQPPTQAQFDAAISAAVNPGRAEQVEYDGIDVVLDVAHNPAGAAFLTEQLTRRYPGRRFVACAGFLMGKDAAGVCAELDPLVKRWVITATGGERGLPAAAAAAASQLPEVDVESDFVQAIATAHMACIEDDILLVVGSFYQVQAMREFLRKADKIAPI